MPLRSGKENIGHNISKLVHEGRSQDQAVAIALDVARRQKHARGGIVSGPMMGPGRGRSDDIAVRAARGSHVIPADVVSAIGNGNSLAGHDMLSKMFPKSVSKKRMPAALKRMRAPSPVKIKPTTFFHGKSTGSILGLADGGGVPVAVSDGEFLISPEEVVSIGQGDEETGHKLLNNFIEDVRKSNIENLRNMEKPV